MAIDYIREFGKNGKLVKVKAVIRHSQRRLKMVGACFQDFQEFENMKNKNINAEALRRALQQSTVISKPK